MMTHSGILAESDGLLNRSRSKTRSFLTERTQWVQYTGTIDPEVSAGKTQEKL